MSVSEKEKLLDEQKILSKEILTKNFSDFFDLFDTVV
jgi:hypothetical protein